MASRLSGQTSIFGVVYLVFFVSKSLLIIVRDKRSLKNLQFGPESLGALLEY